MPESLPENWQSPEALPQTCALGDAWVGRNASALLKVPSTVVAAEANYLLNPNHPDVTKVRMGVQEPFRYDPRLLKRV